MTLNRRDVPLQGPCDEHPITDWGFELAHWKSEASGLASEQVEADRLQARLDRAVGAADALIGWLAAERPKVVREIPVPIMRKIREVRAEIEESGG